MYPLFQELEPYFFLADLSVPTAGFGFVGIAGVLVVLAITGALGFEVVLGCELIIEEETLGGVLALPVIFTFGFCFAVSVTLLSSAFETRAVDTGLAVTLATGFLGAIAIS